MRNKRVAALVAALGLSGALVAAPAFAAPHLSAAAAAGSCSVVVGETATAAVPLGWTPFGDVRVDGKAITVTVPGDWAEAGIERNFDGTLSDIGDQVDFVATPSQYVGIHLVLEGGGELVYEKDASYEGKWWSNRDLGVASSYYATHDTFANILAANPTLGVTKIRVLYTSPVPSSSTISSVTVGCVTTTFSDVPVPQAPEATCPAVDDESATNLKPLGWTPFGAPGAVSFDDETVTISVPGDWAEAGIERDFAGTLADIGDQVDFVATPSQYVGIHLSLEGGDELVYEKDASYEGKWWSNRDLGVASSYYPTHDTFANILAANPTLGVTKIRVLYTSPIKSTTTISSVTVACVRTTFAEAAPTEEPTEEPTEQPTATPSATPTVTPSAAPSTSAPAPSASSIPAPSEAGLTSDNTGGVTVSGEQVPGGTLTVTVTGQPAGTHVGAFVFSTPTFLGEKVVGADHTFQVVLPATLAAGAHRIVVTDVNGAVLGWAPITVAATGNLAATGAGVLPGIMAAAIALAAGAGLVLVRRNARA